MGSRNIGTLRRCFFVVLNSYYVIMVLSVGVLPMGFESLCTKRQCGAGLCVVF